MNKYLMVFAVAVIFATQVTFSIMFFEAYFYNGMHICHAIDDYGEGTIELIFVIVSLPIVMWFLWKAIKESTPWRN